MIPRHYATTANIIVLFILLLGFRAIYVKSKYEVTFIQYIALTLLYIEQETIAVSKLEVIFLYFCTFCAFYVLTFFSHFLAFLYFCTFVLFVLLYFLIWLDGAYELPCKIWSL